MGCDIHCFSETLVDNLWTADNNDPPEWLMSVKPETKKEERSLWDVWDSRDYAVFGVLCHGVRSSWEFSFGQRGFPDPVSAAIEKEYYDWGDDAHSPSYLTLKELKEKAMMMIIHPNKEAQDILPRFRTVIDAFPKSDAKPEDRRIVFWFDN